MASLQRKRGAQLLILPSDRHRPAGTRCGQSRHVPAQGVNVLELVREAGKGGTIPRKGGGIGLPWFRRVFYLLDEKGAIFIHRQDMAIIF